MQSFLTDDRKTGRIPLQRLVTFNGITYMYRGRLVEMTCTLTELLALETDPSSFEPQVSSNTRALLLSSFTEKSQALLKTHLLELYPLLCEGVETTEDELRPLLKALLRTVGETFLNMKAN